MTRKFPALLLLTLIQSNAIALPHLDPEMTGQEYRSIFEKLEQDKQLTRSVRESPLYFILQLGKRNVDWIVAINKHRDKDHQLKLTTPESTQAFPIDQPGFSNPDIIFDRLDRLKKTMPKEMLTVIFSDQTIPDTTSVNDDTFIQNARLLNRIYESASRWILQEPMLDEYAELAKNDIRGYYYLSKEPDLMVSLANWNRLDQKIQDKYSQWLVGECINSLNDKQECQAQMDDAIRQDTVTYFYTYYLYDAKKTYDAYFDLTNPRPEAIWNDQHPELMEFPFTTPERKDVMDWFKVNVEDEWHLDDWSLQISFANRPGLAKIVFEPGTTPNAEGDTITMDANIPLNDYGVRWTIRHEFGHILGFPDCYVEFYDKANQVMVNYQIDTDNLMCSRRGHLQPKHYDQLKKYYYNAY